MDTKDQYGQESVSPLTYEETPVIEPQPTVVSEISSPKPTVVEPQVQSFVPQNSYGEPPRKNRFGSFILKLFGFVLLFVLGIGLSVLLRQYLPQQAPSLTETLPTEDVIRVTPTVADQNIDPLATWKTYSVVSGVTRLPIDFLEFKLPSDVLSPICDGTTCASQGTYLPGGTRFTVAARGQGQLLSDFRGKIVSDLTGKSFTVKQATISGKNATEFSGSFTGSTAGGYAFARMRGVMIEVSPILSLEVNHFIPSGISANFESDDRVFDTILTTFRFSGSITPTATEILSPSVSPSASSGSTQ